MWLPFFRLSLGEPNSMLTQKKSVGGTHLRGGTRGWLWAQCKHSLLCHPASFLPLAPSFPLSGCQEGGGGEALCPFPCPFHPSFSWTLRRFPFRPFAASGSARRASPIPGRFPHCPGWTKPLAHVGIRVSSFQFEWCQCYLWANYPGSGGRNKGEESSKSRNDKVERREVTGLGRRQWWRQRFHQFTQKS